MLCPKHGSGLETNDLDHSSFLWAVRARNVGSFWNGAPVPFASMGKPSSICKGTVVALFLFLDLGRRSSFDWQIPHYWSKDHSWRTCLRLFLLFSIIFLLQIARFLFPLMIYLSQEGQLLKGRVGHIKGKSETFKYKFESISKNLDH